MARQQQQQQQEDGTTDADAAVITITMKELIDEAVSSGRGIQNGGGGGDCKQTPETDQAADKDSGDIILQRWYHGKTGFFWLISEFDEENPDLAYGYANLANDDFAEWGCISIAELKQNGAEQDPGWEPVPFSRALPIARRITVTKSAMSTTAGFHTYNFERAPQAHLYVRTGDLCLKSDEGALEYARKISPNFTYVIEQKEDTEVSQ